MEGFTAKEEKTGRWCDLDPAESQGWLVKSMKSLVPLNEQATPQKKLSMPGSEVQNQDFPGITVPLTRATIRLPACLLACLPYCLPATLGSRSPPPSGLVCTLHSLPPHELQQFVT